MPQMLLPPSGGWHRSRVGVRGGPREAGGARVEATLGGRQEGRLVRMWAGDGGDGLGEREERDAAVAAPPLAAA